MDNLARSKYDPEADKKVKEELLIANIPVLELGVMDKEVKTKYIGILNGFVFQRAWYYWVVKGNMPLNFAEQLYEKYKGLNIRVAGHCGNPAPEEWACNKDYDKLSKPYVDKFLNDEISMEELNKISKDLWKQGEQVINMYHVDTQLGLCKLAEMIRENNICTEIIN